MEYYERKNLPVVLSIIGALGTGASIVLGIKATPNALKSIEEYKKKNNKKDLTIAEKIKVCYKHYIPTALIGVGSIGSNIAGTILSKKAEASLIMGATTGYNLYKKYGDEVKKKLGLKQHKEMIKNIADDEEKPEEIENDKELFYEEFIGYFYANETDIALAVAKMNENINGANLDNKYLNFQTIKDFLELSKATNYNLNPTYSYWGWSDTQLAEKTQRMWLHYEIDEIENKEYKILTFLCDPYDFDDDKLYSDEEMDRLLNYKEEIAHGQDE